MGLAATGLSVAAILNGADHAQTTNDSLPERVAAYERALIAAAPAEHRGNIAEALEALKIPRRTLNEKMARFNPNRVQFIGPSTGEAECRCLPGVTNSSDRGEARSTLGIISPAYPISFPWIQAEKRRSWSRLPARGGHVKIAAIPTALAMVSN